MITVLQWIVIEARLAYFFSRRLSHTKPAWSAVLREFPSGVADYLKFFLPPNFRKEECDTELDVFGAKVELAP